ncbi:MAG: histidine phosphatase family protein [Clostridia bacterium]|nr:histidine phosphatase family protein [Clostridia bacterium]
MITYTIHLIRHGMTQSNVSGAYVGCRTDIPLLKEGAAALKDMRRDNNYPRADLVFSSPLKRCVESAKILYPNKDIITVDDIKECDFGDFEGKTPTELDGRPDFLAWTSGKAPAPNGESSEELVKRLCLGLNKIVRIMMQQEKTSAAVLMHGGTIMMLLAACGLPQRHTAEWQCGFGQGYTIRVTPSLYQRTGAVEVVNIIPKDSEFND